MSKNPYYPTSLTPQEVEAGFYVVQLKMSPSDSGTEIAILPITESGRLIKIHDLVLNSAGYGFQFFCKSLDPLGARHTPAEWKDLQPVIYSSMEDARIGFASFTIDRDLFLEISTPSASPE